MKYPSSCGSLLRNLLIWSSLHEGWWSGLHKDHPIAAMGRKVWKKLSAPKITMAVWGMVKIFIHIIICLLQMSQILLVQVLVHWDKLYVVKNNKILYSVFIFIVFALQNNSLIYSVNTSRQFINRSQVVGQTLLSTFHILRWWNISWNLHSAGRQIINTLTSICLVGCWMLKGINYRAV